MLICDKNKFTCLSCQTNDGAIVRQNCRDLWCGIPGQWDYAKCRNCGLVQQYPLPADTAPFYANYPVHKALSPVLDTIRRIVNRDVYYRPLGDKSQLAADFYGLDFGCGDGNFLAYYKRAVGKGICGYEIGEDNAEAVERNRMVMMFSDIKHLKTYADIKGGFHFISLHNTFEHLTNPLQTLQMLEKMLKPSGEIYIAVPLWDCFEHKIFRQNWSGYDAPRHIFYPQLSHIEEMARQSGLYVGHSRTARFAPSLAGTMSIALSGKLRAPLFNALMPMSYILSFLIPGSLLVVYLKKRMI